LPPFRPRAWKVRLITTSPQPISFNIPIFGLSKFGKFKEMNQRHFKQRGFFFAMIFLAFLLVGASSQEPLGTIFLSQKFKSFPINMISRREMIETGKPDILVSGFVDQFLSRHSSDIILFSVEFFVFPP
jgi:hypothetical protein